MAIKHSDRSIVDFRSRLKGGGTRANLFEVQMAFPNYLSVSDENETINDIPFMVKAAEIPASNIGNIPDPFRGRVLPIAGDRTFDPWTVTIINDTNFRLRDVMEKWSDSINDLQTAQGRTNPEQYQTKASVIQLDRFGSKPADKITELRKYDFVGIYPNVVSSIPLDHGATDTIEEFQVTFNYLYYEVRGLNGKPLMTDGSETSRAGGVTGATVPGGGA